MEEARQTVHTEQTKRPVSMAEYRGKVTETGQDVTVRVPRRAKRKKGWRMHVAMVDIDVMTRLELTGMESRVLFGFASHIPERGGVEARTTTTELATELGTSQQYVAKITKELRDRRIIRLVRQSVYEVNPWVLYNGDFNSWNAETEEWPEPIWRRDGANADTGEI